MKIHEYKNDKGLVVEVTVTMKNTVIFTGTPQEFHHWKQANYPLTAVELDHWKIKHSIR